MLTEERFRAAFHDRADQEVGQLRADPDLLDEVRRAHARRTWLALVVVPISVVLVVVTALTALALRPNGEVTLVTAPDVPAATGAPSPPGPTVVLLGYRFSLPSGFTVTDRSGVVDLGSATPPQPVDGRDQNAVVARGNQSLDITVYQGDIAAAEWSVGPPSPDSVHHTTIAGHEALIDPYGGGTLRSRGPIETRVRVADDVVVFVQSEGMTGVEVREIVADALAR